MAIQWTNDLAVGIQDIDDQHRELFARVGALVDATHELDAGQVTKLFDFLDSYTRDHFLYEEEVQHRTGYPRRNEHKKMHEWFIANLAKLRARYSADGDSDTLRLQLKHFVSDWLVKHIRIEDADLANYLTS